MTEINTSNYNNSVCNAFMPSKTKEKPKTEKDTESSADTKYKVLLNQLNQSAIFNTSLVKRNNQIQDYANAAIKLRQIDQDLIQHEMEFAAIKEQGEVTPELEAQMEDYRNSVNELRSKTLDYQDTILDEIAGPMDAKLDTET